MRCLACFKQFPDGTEVCPRCNFTQYEIIGSDDDEALSALKFMAGRHRAAFLKKYDLGVMIYTWKDQDGTIVLDQKKRLSFGAVNSLVDNTVWLNQKFARIPDTASMIVELSVTKQGSQDRILPVSIRIPQEKQLQQLGVRVDSNLTLTLMLKNDTTVTESNTVDFL